MGARWTLAVWLAAGGCAATDDLVELRLRPCSVETVVPQSVEVEIRPYDAAGEAVGHALVQSFTLPEGALSDGYATLGYRPEPAVVTADFVLRWYESPQPGSTEQGVTATYQGRIVPALGEFIDLGAQRCDEGLAGDDGTGGATTSDPAQPTTEPDGGTGTGAGDSDGGSGATGATNGGDEHGTSEGGTTGGSDSDSFQTTDGNDDIGSSGGESTGGDDPTMEGASCDDPGRFYCEPDPDSGVGTLLQCEGGLWSLGAGVCPQVCELTAGHPNFVGCAGLDINWACLCQADDPQLCSTADNGCDGNVLTLCVEGRSTRAQCLRTCQYEGPSEYECL